MAVHVMHSFDHDVPPYQPSGALIQAECTRGHRVFSNDPSLFIQFILSPDLIFLLKYVVILCGADHFSQYD